MSARKRLDALLADEQAAREREADLGQAANRRSRELTGALADRDRLDRDEGAGRAVDAGEEQRLAELLNDPGIEQRQLDRGPVLVDRRAEARKDGAAEAVAEAQRAVEHHAREHLPELLALVAEDSEGAREELVAAVEAMHAATARWRKVSGEAHRLVRLASGNEDQRDTLLAQLDAAGWRLPPIPIGIDGQAVATYQVQRDRDPDALLPVVLPKGVERS